MTNAHKKLVFVGGNGFVVALRTSDGSEAWRAELNPCWFKTGNQFVSLMEDQEFLYAFSYGMLFKLEKHTGVLVMKGPGIAKLKYCAAIFAVNPDAAAGGAAVASTERRARNNGGQMTAMDGSTGL